MEGLGINYLLAIMQSGVPDLVKYAMHMDTQNLAVIQNRRKKNVVCATIHKQVYSHMRSLGSRHRGAFNDRLHNSTNILLLLLLLLYITHTNKGVVKVQIFNAVK